MNGLLLYLFPLLIILGGGVFGWLARWHKYGGRCKPGGLADGVPNVDIDRGIVALDGTEPAVTAGPRVSQAFGSATSALGSLASGKDAGRDDAAQTNQSSLTPVPDGHSEGAASGDGSVAAKLGAAIGGVAAVAGGAASSVADSAKSAAKPLTDGTAAAKVSDAVANVKDVASGAIDSGKSSLASMRDGYAEGAASGDAPEAPADGSASTKVGAAIGGAVSTIKGTASGAVDKAKSAAAPLTDGTATAKASDIAGNAVERVKGAASGAVDASKSSLASVRGGYTESTESDAPSDGSTAAKVGAAIGGAVLTVKDAASGVVDKAKSAATPLMDGTATANVSDAASNAVESAKDAASDAVAAGKSSLDAVRDGYAEEAMPDKSASASGAGSVAGKAAAAVGSAVSGVRNTAASVGDKLPGATIGQEDGYVAGPGDAADDEEEGAKPEVVVPETLSDTELEAQRLLDSEEVVARPATLLAAPEAGRAPDDLKRIKGIGPKIKKTLNDEGVYYFDQIAAFGSRDIAWADQTLAIKGRVVRDRWVPQAQGLAALPSEYAAVDTDAMRTRFASLADEENEGIDFYIPETLSEAEQEAQRLIESDEVVAKPGNTLAAPEAGRAPDDLKRIKGIGPKIEETLNGEGIYYFDQIADFGGRDLAWADRTLGFRGRVVRDRWIPQAKGLAALYDEADAEFADNTGASGAVTTTPLRLAEAEALRLIERDGGYAASADNRPSILMNDGPVSGAPDDLKQIKGIGEKLERLLNGLGVYYFRQIAAFTASDIAWVDSKLKFKGRIIRDRWVPQADAFDRGRDS